jgi:GNAT superfamily N-acetyltransferase
LLVACLRGIHAGGAVVARDTPGVDMLESRRDLAVLWDLRVAHGMRRCGIGTALFRATERWARAQGCRELKIETQNVNVPACRFYARQGCVLSAAQPFAYAQLRDEVRFLWRKELRGEETI